MSQSATNFGRDTGTRGGFNPQAALDTIGGLWGDVKDELGDIMGGVKPEVNVQQASVTIDPKTATLAIMALVVLVKVMK